MKVLLICIPLFSEFFMASVVLDFRNQFIVYVVSVYVVHPYSSVNAVTDWKKSRFILLDRLDFYTWLIKCQLLLEEPVFDW